MKPSIVPTWATNTTTNILTSLDVNNITYLGLTSPFNLPTVRYSFSGSPNLSTVLIGHSLKVVGSTNLINDGQFKITNVNVASFYVDVINGARFDSNLDETSSPAVADVTTLSPELQEPSNAKKGQGFIAGEKPSASYFNFQFYWIGKWLDWINTAFSGFVTETNTITTLRAVNVADVGNGSLYYVKEIDAIYRYNDTLTATNDGEFYVTPLTGAGAWEKYITTQTDLEAQTSHDTDYQNSKIRDLINRIETLEGV